jgi:hypothetical protein
VDTLPLHRELPCGDFDWVTVEYYAGCNSNAGLDCAIFPLEPLVVAQGTEAIFRNGSLKVKISCSLLNIFIFE